MDSSSSTSISRSLAFSLALHVMIFTGSLTKFRTEMTKENLSAFEVNGNRGYMIIPIVALFALEVSTWILFFKNIPSRYYSILKFIDIFMVFFAPFSLLNVLYLSTEQNWIVPLIPCVIMAITSAYVSSGNDEIDKNLNKASPVAIFTYMGLVLAPLMLMMVLFVPQNLNSIVFPVLHLFFGLEAICFCIIYKFMMLPMENITHKA